MLRGQWCNQYLQRSSPIIKVVVSPPRILIQAFFPPDSQTTPGPTRRAPPPLLLHLPALIQSAGEQAAPHNLFAGGIFLQYCMIEIILKQASWQLWPLLACSTAWPSGEKCLKSTCQSTCILSQSTFPSWAPSLERSLVPSEELITSNSQQLH